MSFTCEKCQRQLPTQNGLKQHSKFCTFTEQIKNEIIELYKAGHSTKEIMNMNYSSANIALSLIGITRIEAKKKRSTIITQEQKNKISISMKKAHAEGRAWHIGNNKKNKTPSYAEIFFLSFLERIGFKKDKDFFTEFPFNTYKADFFFPAKNLIIEIDGMQHTRFEQRRLHDIKRDDFIKTKYNVQILRLNWQIVHNDAFNQLNEIQDILNKTQNQHILINKLSLAQQNKLTAILHVEQQILQQKELKKQRAQQFLDERRKLLESVDFSKFGWVAKVGKKFGVSHSQARRFLKRHFPEIEKTAYKKKLNSLH